MRRLAEHIVCYLEKCHVITPTHDEREIYVYGFDIAIYTLISTFALVLMGVLIGYPTEVLIMIFLLSMKQKSARHRDIHEEAADGLHIRAFHLMQCVVSPASSSL